MPSPTEIFWTFGAFAFVFGALIGSFLNVVIYRVPAGLSVVSPGSRCPTCGEPVRFYDNIPILSWFLLRGRCRHCKTPFSARYAAVEALTGALAFAAWWQAAGGLLRLDELGDAALLGPVAGLFLLRFTLYAFLVAITFIDLDHFIIPHAIALPGIALGLASPWVTQLMLGAEGAQMIWPPVTPMMSLVGAIAGFLTVVGLFYAYWAIRGAEGIGGGDATLMALIGAWLGWPALLFVLFAASLQGVIAAGISMLVGGGVVRDASELFADDDPRDETREEPSEEPRDEPRGEPRDEPGDTDGHAEQPDGTPDDADPHAGRLAVPFGPFLALAALEFAILGPIMPPELNMIYLYL